MFCNLRIGNSFLGHKKNMKKWLSWTSQKLKSPALRKCHKKMKRNATDWEKIVTTHMWTKELYPESMKNSYKSRIRSAVGKRQKYLNRHFTKIKQHMKTCSTGLVIREMQTKST